MSSWIDVEANRKALQSALKLKGLYSGIIDGVLGLKSLTGMQSVERTIGISETIYFDPRILPYLHLTPETETPVLSLLPTIVQWIVSLLPGIPDDIAIVEAELKELASTDSGKVKLASALAFGKVLIEKIEAVLAAHP